MNRQASVGVQTQHALLRNAACEGDGAGSNCPCEHQIRPRPLHLRQRRAVRRLHGGEAITAERTGEVCYFRHRDTPERHEVLMPEGAPERFGRAADLWNAAEAAERRKNAQVAREIVLALPADRAGGAARATSITRVAFRPLPSRKGAGVRACRLTAAIDLNLVIHGAEGNSWKRTFLMRRGMLWLATSLFWWRGAVPSGGQGDQAWAEWPSEFRHASWTIDLRA